MQKPMLYKPKRVFKKRKDSFEESTSRTVELVYSRPASDPKAAK
jgi:hypothetical protein